jgi:hypothetical protein
MAVNTIGAGVVLNEGQIDVDFRVEGNNVEHLLMVDGSSDRVGIGIAAPERLLHLQDDTEANLAIETNNNGASNFAGFRRYKSRGTKASPTVVADDDTLAMDAIYGYDGNSYATAASIEYKVDGTPGDGDMPTRIEFSTSADGSQSPTTRMTILSDGKVGIGETAPQSLLHVRSADSGATVHASADEIIAEGSGNAGISILTGTGDEGSIYFGDSGDNDIGRIRYAHSSNKLDFRVNALINMTLTGDKVGIGVASPSNILDVRRADSSDGEAISFGSQGYYMGRLGEDASSNKVFLANIYNSDAAYIDFRVKGSAVAQSKMNIRGNGNVTIGAGSLIIGTSGKGIDFSAEAASGASGTDRTGSVLNDYEEGTWTPTFTVPSGSVGYSTQTGSYTKVGSLVTAIFALGLNSISSPSGNSGVSGFPFPASSGENFVAAMSIALARAFTTSFADHSIRGYLVNNGSSASLHTGDSSQGHVDLNANTLTASTQFYGTVTYNTDG